MKINVLEELEIHFNEIAERLNQIKKSSLILQDYIQNNNYLKQNDVENLTSVLKQKFIEIGEKFALLEEELNFQ